MFVYQVPIISTFKQEPFLSQLQYQPVDCSSNINCGDGSMDSLCSGDFVSTDFFLPGQDPGVTPNCTALVNGVPPQGCTPPTLEDATCPGGSVWLIACSDAINDCNTGVDTVTITCVGYEEGVCDTFGIGGS
jgi:hypothetical protein